MGAALEDEALCCRPRAPRDVTVSLIAAFRIITARMWMSKWTRLSAPLTNKHLPFCSMSNQRYGIRKKLNKKKKFNNVSSLSKLKMNVLFMHKNTLIRVMEGLIFIGWMKTKIDWLFRLEHKPFVCTLFFLFFWYMRFQCLILLTRENFKEFKILFI